MPWLGAWYPLLLLSVAPIWIGLGQLFTNS